MCVCGVCGGCRETEYSRATAELVKEAGQVRAESGRLKDRLEASEKEVEELRNEMKQRREAEQSNTSTLSQELATRGKQASPSPGVCMGEVGLCVCVCVVIGAGDGAAVEETAARGLVSSRGAGEEAISEPV